MLAIAWIFISSGKSDKQQLATSTLKNVQISDNINTFTNDLFRFSDSGKWTLSKSESSLSKYVYYKFHNSDIQGQLFVYVNQVPPQLNLAVSRVLPIRIVNDNSFNVTSLSGPCVGSYAVGELHKVKIISINNAEMMCDPDTPQYTAVISEINGNYRLNLKKSNGKAVNLIITYRDMRQEPNPDSLLSIANTFKVL